MIMHALVVMSPNLYMGACTSNHASNQSAFVQLNHTSKSSAQVTNHGVYRSGWQPQIQPNTTPCMLSSRLPWACIGPLSQLKPSWATNHPLQFRAHCASSPSWPLHSSHCVVLVSYRYIWVGALHKHTQVAINDTPSVTQYTSFRVLW
jgi:hypothetical protein